MMKKETSQFVAISPKAMEGRPLADIFEDLNRPQKEYLMTLLSGGTDQEALKAAEKIPTNSTACPENWLDSEKWLSTKGYVMCRRFQYQRELLGAWAEEAGMMSVKLLHQLVKRGLDDWDNQAIEDKRCIMQAVGVIGRLAKISSDNSGGGSYEELIHKIHKEVKEDTHG